jgi:hypothetical protein
VRVTAAQIDQIWRLPRAAYVHRSVAHSGGFGVQPATSVGECYRPSVLARHSRGGIADDTIMTWR